MPSNYTLNVQSVIGEISHGNDAYFYVSRKWSDKDS